MTPAKRKPTAAEVVARRRQVARMVHAGMTPEDMVSNLHVAGISATPQAVRYDVKYVEARAQADFATQDALAKRLAARAATLEDLDALAFQAAMRNPDDPDNIRIASVALTRPRTRYSQC